ncbi:MAG: pyrroline-5-carboxylate reductase [Gemmataceae bacterium]
MAAEVPRFGFLGAGKMATALAKGWIGAGLAYRDRCVASDPSEDARAIFAAETGAATTTDNRKVVRESDVVVLAVKPQNVMEVLEDIRLVVTSDHLIISIAAGITLDRIADRLKANCRLIRVMPNTPCLVQESAAAYAPGPTATAEDVAFVGKMLDAVGKSFAVPEKLMDAVTGLSGSGPAFVYTVIEALSDGGVLVGLPRSIATTLAAQTVLGAAKMVLESGLHTGELKDQVASPGGTTIAGLQVLERAGVRSGLIDAVQAAARRSTELNQAE